MAQRGQGAWCLIAALFVGCGEEPAPVVEPTGPAGCVPGERPFDDGTCRPAGIPAYGCGEGFDHDGDSGCEPILPVDPCPPGTMAVPGDLACREIAPCGDGPWGTIPVDGTTEHVDQSYVGGSSDGSSAAPWTTIAEGITAAAPGAIVAIAAGSYHENLVVDGKPVRLWGKCPAEVAVLAADTGLPVLRMIAGAHGTEVRSLSLGGSATWPAVGVAACENVVLSHLWIHDNGTLGLMLEDQGGPTSATLADSLIERVGDVGVVVFGASLGVERSVVRDTGVGPLNLMGRGIDVETSSSGGGRGVTTIARSVIARTGDTGLYVGGADATVAGSVIVDAGAAIPGSGLGRAIGVERIATRSTCTVSQSLVDRAREIGIYGASSDLVVDLTVVRDTLPRDTDQFGGRGVNVETAPDGGASTLVLASSLIERSVEVGVAVIDGVAVIESTRVWNTASTPLMQQYGTGVCVQEDLEEPLASDPELTLRWSRIEGSHAFGVVVQSATASLEGVWISDTWPIEVDQTFGDSVAVIDRDGPAWLTVAGSHFEQSARAGLAMFGGTGHLSTTELECNAIHLTGQPHMADFQLVDDGGNRCGCGGQSDNCTVLSAQLDPPEPVGSVGQ